MTTARDADESATLPAGTGAVGGHWVRELVQRHRKEGVVVGAMLVILAGPYLLKPADSTTPSRYDRRLVLVSPHHETIRKEYGRAFARHWQEQTGEVVFVDWRVPGGTSEIAKMLKSDYAAAFQILWERKLGQRWSAEVAQTFMDRKADPAAPARKTFLESQVGIGVDVFFGGGPYDFQQQAQAGTLVASVDGEAGLRSIREGHPEWFTEESIPLEVRGEAFRDEEDRWVGTCLSSFGIVFNRDVLKRLGIEGELSEWRELTDPRLRGQVALADPSKSGSVTKAFEMLIQQQMRLALDAMNREPGELTESAREEAAVKLGWREGLRMIQAIGANARYFTDSSTKIPLEVARGDAAAGMCIDYYGRATAEQVKREDGSSRVAFVAPEGGTSVAVDPVGLLRGAPDPELGTAFIEFVLSEAGQVLWAYPAGVPGGPESMALRRLPVRRDLYQSPFVEKMVDGEERPFEKAQAFQYEPKWTGPAFNAIRFLIRVMCVDTHSELTKAWEELDRAGFPPQAVKALTDFDLVRYEVATGSIAATLAARDKTGETRLARQLGDLFRRQYELAFELAREGR